MKKIYLFILCCLVVVSTNATTIVIYLTPEFVIMAADSKGFYNNAKTLKQESRIISKIYKTADIYFSLSGIIANTQRNLDISRIIHHHLSNSKNLDSAIAEIKNEVRKSLLTYVGDNRKNNPKLFAANLNVGTYVTSIGLVTLKKSKPYAHIIGFKIINGAQMNIKVEEDFAALNSGERSRLFFLGKNNAINHYLDTVKKINPDPFLFVDKLMSVQINKNPESVGAPVDILQISLTETKWFRRKKTTPIELKK